MTKNIPEGDKLFTGLEKIAYEDYEPNDNFTNTQKEVEAALAQWFLVRKQLPPLALLVWCQHLEPVC